MKTRTTHVDRETRQRLLESAERLFAARGFKQVTVRDICREARANYCFGGVATR